MMSALPCVWKAQAEGKSANPEWLVVLLQRISRLSCDTHSE